MNSRLGKTCIPCRIRKVKCDGHPERCNPCKRSRKYMECTYGDTSLNKKMPRLQKGEACAPCSRKKKRCNAARPCCDTCQVARKEHECTYPDIPVISSSRWNKRTRRTQSVSPKATTALDAKLPCTDAASTSAALVPVLPPLIDQARELNYTLNLSPPQIASAPSISPYPAFGQYACPYLDVTQSYDPLLFALSDVSSGDLNMNFRIIFLTHRLQFGFRFTFVKEQAILLGDLSNVFIHPFFIHFAHMFGCNLYQERQGNYFLLPILGAHLNLTLAALAKMSDDDPLSFAQACHLMMVACLYNHDPRLGRRFLNLAIGIVKRNEIRFVPRSQYPPPDFSEEVHERASFLCDLMSSETDLILITGNIQASLLDLQKQFQQELPNVYPMLFNVCPITIRMGSILLAKEAAVLLSSYTSQTIPSSSWFSSCEEHLNSVISQVLRTAIQIDQHKKTKELDNCISLQYSSFVFMFTLTEIYRILERHPLAPECQAKCKHALGLIGQILEDVSEENLQYLYQVMGICWARAFSVFGYQKHAMTKVWSPLCPSNSIFASASLFLMSQCQTKLASLLFDCDALVVCERLEILQHPTDIPVYIDNFEPLNN